MREGAVGGQEGLDELGVVVRVVGQTSHQLQQGTSCDGGSCVASLGASYFRSYALYGSRWCSNKCIRFESGKFNRKLY